jgi:hypothetical protein
MHLPNIRVDNAVLKDGGLRKAFFVGGNSTCRVHIRQHYTLYQQRCKDKNLPENHHALPRPIWKKMQEMRSGLKTKTQSKLDGMVEKFQGPREFTREGALHAITQFIACNDQVSVQNLESGVELNIMPGGGGGR